MKEGNHLVNAASPDAIFQKLMDPFYNAVDDTFTDTILYTHSYFIGERIFFNFEKYHFFSSEML